MKQKGYTLIELLFALLFVSAVVSIIAGGYILFHFLQKVW